LLYKIPCYLICFIKYIQIVTKSLILNPPFLSIFYNPICNLHSKKMMQNAWENIQLFFIVHPFYFILTLMCGCRSMRISNVNNGNFYDKSFVFLCICCSIIFSNLYVTIIHAFWSYKAQGWLCDWGCPLTIETNSIHLLSTNYDSSMEEASKRATA
jgi:hypothetical protein